MPEPAPSLATTECQCCGFDLAKTPATDPCPECGAPPRAARSRRGEPVRLAIVALSILLWCIPVAVAAYLAAVVIGRAQDHPGPVRTLSSAPLLGVVIGAVLLSRASAHVDAHGWPRLERWVYAMTGMALAIILVRAMYSSAALETIPGFRMFLVALHWGYPPVAAVFATTASLRLIATARSAGLVRLAGRCVHLAWLPLPVLGVWFLSALTESAPFVRLFPVPAGRGQPGGYIVPRWVGIMNIHTTFWACVIATVFVALFWAAACRIRVRLLSVLEAARERRD